MRRHRLEVHVPRLRDVLTRTYDMAIFESFEREFRRPARGGEGQPRISPWGLDLRIPLSRAELLTPIASELADGLAAIGVTQVVGAGFGAYALVGAVLASSTTMTGALLREKTKGYGYGAVVEGALSTERPVALLDDLLSTGGTALAVRRLLHEHGFTVTEVHTVFALGFRPGVAALGAAGIGHRCLATLHPDPGFQRPRELT